MELQKRRNTSTCNPAAVAWRSAIRDKKVATMYQT